jgi:hypothetical protein
MKTITSAAIILAGAATISVIASAAFANSSVVPTGVTRYDPVKAWNDYVLFSGADEKTHLIDMNGHEVHRWEYQGFPGEMLDPKVVEGASGHILVQLEPSKQAGIGTAPGVKIPSSKSVGELDWDGKVIWKWSGEGTASGEALQHHDWQRLPGGNTLPLANWPHKVPSFALPQQLDDVVYEVTAKGDLVWQWAVSAHLDESALRPNSSSSSEMPRPPTISI